MNTHDIVKGMRIVIRQDDLGLTWSGTVRSVVPAYGVRITRDDTQEDDWFAFAHPGRTFHA